MRLKNPLRSVFWLLSIIVLSSAYSHARPPAPAATVENQVFEFAPVIAGQAVTHGFTIQNTGDKNLNIPGVYSG